MIGVEKRKEEGWFLAIRVQEILISTAEESGKVDRSVAEGNKGEEDWRGRDEEERGRGGETGRRGGVLGDTGSENPGRRPRVPASYN